MSNILYITLDQLSLHALSCYESYLCETPAIDALARDGVLFSRAYTCCALCTPARASMLTGLYPHNHGALHNSGVMLPFTEREIGARVGTFTEVLRRMDYRLGYQGKWHAGIAETAADVGFRGFGPRGYGHYTDSDRYLAYLEENGLREVDTVVEFYAQSESNRMDSSGYQTGDLRATGPYFITEETIRMIDEFSASDTPFFHWLSFWGPHAPYWPHESYKDRYRSEEVRRWDSFDEDWHHKPYVHRRFRETVMRNAANADWEVWSTIICRYYALTRMIDDQIGRLTAHLKERQLYDDMTIILTADHGDSLGIHGGVFDKGPMAYEQLYHIPLIVKQPGRKNGGAVHGGYTSILDIAPTLCDIAGGVLPHGDGRSLLPVLAEPERGGREDFAAEFHGHRFPVGQRILWWNDYKYILNFADRDELYHLQEDPEEMRNLISHSEYGEIRAELRRRMVRSLHEARDNLHPQALRVLSNPLDD